VGEVVFWAFFVNGSEFDAHYPFFIGFLDHKKVCKPVRMLYFFHNSNLHQLFYLIGNCEFLLWCQIPLPLLNIQVVHQCTITLGQYRACPHVSMETRLFLFGGNQAANF